MQNLKFQRFHAERINAEGGFVGVVPSPVQKERRYGELDERNPGVILDITKGNLVPVPATAQSIMTQVRNYLALTILIGFSINLRAALLVVTTNTDSGPGSLRDAVATANAGDTITFNNSLSGQTIVLTSGPIGLNQDVTIDADALAGGIIISGNDASSIFTDSTNNVALNNLDLINGNNINGDGGGIYNLGTLTLSNCAVSGNIALGMAGANGGAGAPGSTFPFPMPGGPGGAGGNGTPGNGGGIYNNASLSLINCTLSTNQATGGSGGAGGAGGFGVPSGMGGNGASGASGAGGGIYNDSSGSVNLVNCTSSANETTGGNGGDGGVSAGGMNGFAGNGGFGYGGDIYNAGLLTVINYTSSGNQAGGGIAGASIPSSGINGLGDGGGIYNANNAMITNSIIANNSVQTNGNGADVDNSASLTYGGTNLVQSAVNSGTISGPNPINASPDLAPLGNYGGLTQTMPPLPGSPAVDAAADAITNFLATDQRGYPRLAGLHVDIGAVEGIYNAAGAGALTAASPQRGVPFQFSFTNYEDMTFTVFASTNLALSFNQWTDLGPATENPAGSGQFEFSDMAATNLAKRFYRVASP